MDFSNRCRGCLSNDEEVLQPFEDSSMVRLFEECVRIQISAGPNLPKQICISCYGKCSAWDKFRQQCLETNELINYKLSCSELTIISVGSINTSESLFKDDSIGHKNPETVEEHCLVPNLVREETHDEGSSEAVFSLDELGSAAEASEEQISAVPHEVKNGRDIECPRCPVKFRSMERFNAHWRKHQGLRPEVCKVCNGEFNSVRALRRHMMKHVDGKKFTCHECGKSYKYATSLTLHRKCHQEAPRRYVCECGKSFIRAHGLKSHMSSHSTEKPFECSQCQKQFKNEIMLRNHVVRIHEGFRRFSCSTCEKTFKTSAELNIHVRSHTNEKPYNCKECGKSYKVSSHLKVHFRNAHTAERPYACEYCPLKFGYSKALKCHQLIHTKEKPWQCQVCQQSFRQQSTLNSHMRTHGPGAGPPDNPPPDTTTGIDLGLIDVIESSQ